MGPSRQLKGVLDQSRRRQRRSRNHHLEGLWGVGREELEGVQDRRWGGQAEVLGLKQELEMMFE
jgi:hypothetical protein